jgi:hypothetical protein
MNRERVTVIGILEGPSDEVDAMTKLLQTFGSRKSKIEKAEFHNKRNINTVSYAEFVVRY